MPTSHLCWGLLSTARINKALLIPLRTSKRNQIVGGREPVTGQG